MFGYFILFINFEFSKKIGKSIVFFIINSQFGAKIWMVQPALSENEGGTAAQQKHYAMNNFEFSLIIQRTGKNKY